MEGTSLTDTLRALQLDHEAAEIDRLEGAPLDVALLTLPDILPRLFRAAAA